MTTPTIEPLWTVQEVSTYLRVPQSTLYQWRYLRTGPRASRVGRHLRYDPADVRAWLADQAA
ncbi:helix-turn-helix domain-containing protein [Solwaraspora sp. WMMD792]|uniref:helix-turn-helix transcriptional regulator n=1 Tax=Solwaraspora sp. WMMD792 TaxID=3016099 RepID=UPI0024180A18|nr:helix-turn-helix domain-containing protein [Solwaraspora sp. WMMD792]MDG4774077.1 helix-turn-helix domain-containing protein [Solwaraspora sp. WMMD792]